MSDTVEAPGLEPIPPPCSICHVETDPQPEGLVCTACRFIWSYDNVSLAGVPIEPDVPRCGLTYEPDPRDKAVFVCVRPEGHEAAHCVGFSPDAPERYAEEWLDQARYDRVRADWKAGAR